MYVLLHSNRTIPLSILPGNKYRTDYNTYIVDGKFK